MKFDISKLRPQQRASLESAVKSYQNKDPISSPSPAVLFLELTQNCISRCAFCHGPDWKNQPSFNMSQDIFEIIMRDYVPYAAMVDLRGRGESLMLPHFPEYLRRIAELGPKIRLVTTLGCGTQEALQMLVDYDVFVNISFDAAEKVLYESIRCGIKYDTVIKNLEFLAGAMFAKYGSLEGRISIAICPLQRKNLRSVEGILELAHRLKISNIVMGPLIQSPEHPDHLNSNKFETVKAFEQCGAYAKRYGLHFLLSKPPFDAARLDEKVFDRCCHPWLYALITYTGSMIFCDHLLGIPEGDEAVLGNIRTPKEQVWNGQQAQHLRMTHVDRSRGLIRQCADCYRDGRYAEFEEAFCPELKRCNFTEQDISYISRRFVLKKYLFLIQDIVGALHRKARLFVKSRFHKLDSFLARGHNSS